MPGGLVGRKAGSAPGYKYSPALSDADLPWSPDNLDRWLADPRKFIPDARMPVRVIEASARRDIIAYLKQKTSEPGDQLKPRPVSQSPGQESCHERRRALESDILTIKTGHGALLKTLT